MEILVQKPLVVGKLGMFSGMWNDALMHRGGLKGKQFQALLFEIQKYFSAVRFNPYSAGIDFIDRIWRL